MGQDTISVGLPSLSLAAVLIACAALGAACQEDESPRQIRAHTTLRGGVSHAEPAQRAERYCAHCHGVGLNGGAQAEPSCYTCHGKTWSDDAFGPSPAPADHAVINQEFHHQPQLFTPAASCASCHGGEGLSGNVTSGLTVPGCELCHGRLWEERAPPLSLLR